MAILTMDIFGSSSDLSCTAKAGPVQLAAENSVIRSFEFHMHSTMDPNDDASLFHSADAPGLKDCLAG